MWHQLSKNMRNNSEVYHQRDGICLYPCTHIYEKKRWVSEAKDHATNTANIWQGGHMLRWWVVVLPAVFVEWLKPFFTSGLFKPLILKIVHHIAGSLWLDCSEWAACLKFVFLMGGYSYGINSQWSKCPIVGCEKYQLKQTRLICNACFMYMWCKIIDNRFIDKLYLNIC